MNHLEMPAKVWKRGWRSAPAFQSTIAWYTISYYGYMSASLIDVHFVRLRTFERTAKGLLSDDDEREIEKDIAQDPEAAPIVTATGGVRKIRGRLGQRGKRGSVRILYLYLAATETVYLLLAFSKNTRANISKAEKRRIRAMVERLRDEQE